MEKLAVEGGKPLSGSLRIHGAKNSALPILAATVLADGQYSIQDVPRLSDISVMLQILTELGAETAHEGSRVHVNTKSLCSSHIPKDLMGQMRSSIFLMGPLLARFGEVIVHPPGGCAIGERKINLHLEGLSALGAVVIEFDDHILCQADQLHGADIHLAYPSVGATENIMMAAVTARGKTTIRNAAREPEITDLQSFLNSMGACVIGAGSSVIEIVGVQDLHPVDYKVIPDRIVAGTFILAASLTGSQLTLKNTNPEHLAALIDVVQRCGVEIQHSNDIINIDSKLPYKSIEFLDTKPYPGFPTDMQAQLMVFLATAQGNSLIQENVFEGRFRHVEELRKMGAFIEIRNHEAHVLGRTSFKGTEVHATDLRGGAALILAGLAASGTTYIRDIYHIDRGYERIEKQFQSIGANVSRIKD